MKLKKKKTYFFLLKFYRIKFMAFAYTTVAVVIVVVASVTHFQRR